MTLKLTWFAPPGFAIEPRGQAMQVDVSWQGGPKVIQLNSGPINRAISKITVEFELTEGTLDS
jgi:hypothetical protein